MKNIISVLLLIASILLFTGCSASYQNEFMNQQSNHTYAPSRILLITPENGTYEDIDYPTSGDDVIFALKKELSRYTPVIGVIPNPIPIENIEEQVLEQTDYIILPKILHWEDRATGWSFRPDRIEILFEIYNNKRELIDAYRIKGRSAYVVWVSKQPKSLLPRPIRTMCEDLFGKIQN